MQFEIISDKTNTSNQYKSHESTVINKRLTLLCLVLLQIPLCLSAPVQKKFDIVRNDHGYTQRCEFSVLD